MYITEAQKRALAEYLRDHPELRNPKFTSRFTKNDCYALWQNLANKLNKMVGPSKDFKVWRKTYQDLCSRIKQKLAKNLQEMNKTDGGEAAITPLNEIENIIAEFISPVALQKLDVPQTEIVLNSINNSSFDVKIEETEILFGGSTFETSQEDAANLEEVKALQSSTSRVMAPQLRQTLKRKKMSAHTQRFNYLKKKIKLKENYYEKKLGIMKEIANNLGKIAEAIAKK